jgi:hypothetical protein
MAKLPRNLSLSDHAAAQRRRMEYKSLEDAWKNAEVFLHLDDLTSAQRARIKMAFTLGWQGGTNYHTRLRT